MKVDEQQRGRVSVIRLQGEMTLDVLEPLKKVIDQRVAGDATDFVLDLSQLEFVDSRGLETLLWAQDRAAEQLGQVRLAGPTEPVQQILHVTRLEKDFETHETVEAAIESLQ